MESRVFLLLVCLAAGALGAARKLPAVLTACARDDPKLSECALKSARAALPIIVAGIPSLGLPPSDPLHVASFSVDDTGSRRQVALALSMVDLDITGLKDTHVKSVTIDVDGGFFSYTGMVPRLSLLGRYQVAGRVLVLPVRGHGAINVTLENTDFTYSVKLPRKKSKDGTEYLAPEGGALEFSTSRCHIDLENLFGNKDLSDRMNVFLNENWREMVSDLGPPIGELLSSATTQVMRTVLKQVPLELVAPQSKD